MSTHCAKAAKLIVMGITEVNQLRNTLSENEEFCESLQQAHDSLAIRCTELERECTESLHLRSRDSQTLVETQHALVISEGSVKDLEVKQERAGNVISDLQKTLHEVEKQLEVTGSEYVECITKHGKEVEGLYKRVGDIEAVVEGLEVDKRGLQEELGEKDAESRSLSVQLGELEIKLEREIRRLEMEVEAEKKGSAAKDATITQLGNQLKEMEVAQLVDTSQNTVDTAQLESLQEKIISLESELRMKSDLSDSLTAENGKIRAETYDRIRRLESSAREFTSKMSKLETKLSDGQKEIDQKSRLNISLTTQLDNLKSNNEKSQQTISLDLKNALRQLSAKESIITVLREKVRTVGFAGDEKFAIVQAEVDTLKKENEGLNAKIAEAEMIAQRDENERIKMVDERKKWDAERSEVSS